MTSAVYTNISFKHRRLASRSGKTLYRAKELRIDELGLCSWSVIPRIQSLFFILFSHEALILLESSVCTSKKQNIFLKVLEINQLTGLNYAFICTMCYLFKKKD